MTKALKRVQAATTEFCALDEVETVDKQVAAEKRSRFVVDANPTVENHTGKLVLKRRRVHRAPMVDKHLSAVPILRSSQLMLGVNAMFNWDAVGPT